MKIVCCAYLHGFGGAEKQIIMLANEMSRRGHSVYLLSLAAHNPCYPIDPKVEFIKLVENCDKNSIKRIWKRYLLLRKEIIKIVPDVVINFWLQSVYLIALISKKYYGKLIYSERGDPGDTEYSGIKGMLRNLSFRRVDQFVFQTKAAKKYFSNEIQMRASVIYNAVLIDKQMIGSWTGEKKIVVSVGRLSKQKNFRVLIDAFKEIADMYQDYQLQIYGEGELKPLLEDYIKESKLEDRIYLMGVTNKLHEAVKNCKVFVLSSDYEGMPNALIEAMAIGVPCISTNYRPVNSVKEFMVDNEAGLISNPDDANDLSFKIKTLLSDKSMQKRFSEKGIENISKYSYQNVYNAWEMLIMQVSKEN